MSTKKLAIRGVAFSWLGRICSFAITFVVTPIVVHGLGNEAYGIWAIVISMTGYYMLADLGLRSATVKYISQFAATDDWESANKVVATSLAVYSLLAVAACLLAGCVAAIFPLIFATGQQESNTVRWVVLLTGVIVSVRILGQTFGAVLAALKRFDIIHSLTFVALVLQATLIVTMLWMGHGLLAMALVTLLVAILRELCRYLLAKRIAGHLSLSMRFFERKMLGTLFRFGGLRVMQGAAGRITQSAGAIVIGIVLGPVSVTFYAIAESLTRKSTNFSKGVSGVLMPVASHLDAQADREGLVQAYFLVTRGLLTLALALATILIAFGSPLIDLWIGKGYSSSTYPVLCFLALAMIVRMPSNCARSILTGMNRMGYLTKVALFEALGIVVLGAVLAKATGLVGMASAVLGVQVVTAGVLIPVFACRVLRVSLSRYLRKIVLPAATAAFPGLVVAMIAVQASPPTHLIHVIVQSLCIALVTTLSASFICLDKQTRGDILRSVRGRKRSAASGSAIVPSSKH